MNSLFPDAKNSATLCDKEIAECASHGILITKETYSPASLEASSYDIRVGKKGIVGGDGNEIDLTSETLEIPPGAYAGIVSYENMNFPKNIAARLGSKRALSYEGIILLTGSIVDPGYKGHLLFGLYNASQKKVHIRYGRKICSIVFEKLGLEPDKEVLPEPNLLHGNFPDAFLDKIANMEVLPWMQISERVKQIENITKDIIDLKARYEDVLNPIKDLTDNVKSLAQNINTISNQTKTLADDLEKANTMIGENSKQINQLTHNLTIVSTEYKGMHGAFNTFISDLKEQDTKVQKVTVDLQTLIKRNTILWAIILLLAGALLSWLISKALH